jgi:thiaminase
MYTKKSRYARRLYTQLKQLLPDPYTETRKELYKMQNVFSYFVAIGSGLATGIVIVLAPCYWIYKKLENRRTPTNEKQY